MSLLQWHPDAVQEVSCVTTAGARGGNGGRKGYGGAGGSGAGGEGGSQGGSGRRSRHKTNKVCICLPNLLCMQNRRQVDLPNFCMAFSLKLC